MTKDLTTTYLGLKLRNPVVASASPLTGNLDSLRALEASGAAAVVLQSLFAEQIEHDEYEVFHLHEYGGHSSAESLNYFPKLEQYHCGPEPYLESIQAAKRELSIPIIASLNGTTPGKWTRYAKLMEQAGADAIELNIYFVPTDIDMSAADVENRYIEIVESVTHEVAVPVAVKLGPFFSSFPNFARRILLAGARGLVLFNRYLDPELNTETLRVEPRLVLSSRHELRLVLRWVGILHDQIEGDLAATGGIHNADDCLKALLAGARVTMMASALINHGPLHITKVLNGISEWLEQRQYNSIAQLIGSVSRNRGADPSAFERANYMKTLLSYSKA